MKTRIYPSVLLIGIFALVGGVVYGNYSQRVEENQDTYVVGIEQKSECSPRFEIQSSSGGRNTVRIDINKSGSVYVENPRTGCFALDYHIPNAQYSRGEDGIMRLTSVMGVPRNQLSEFVFDMMTTWERQQEDPNFVTVDEAEKIRAEKVKAAEAENRELRKKYAERLKNNPVDGPTEIEINEKASYNKGILPNHPNEKKHLGAGSVDKNGSSSGGGYIPPHDGSGQFKNGLYPSRESAENAGYNQREKIEEDAYYRKMKEEKMKEQEEISKRGERSSFQVYPSDFSNIRFIAEKKTLSLSSYITMPFKRGRR